MIKYVALGTILLISGCITVTEQRQRTSSYYTGCAPYEIEIKSGESSKNSNTWTATCHGKKFNCNDAVSPTCKEETKQSSCRRPLPCDAIPKAEKFSGLLIEGGCFLTLWTLMPGLRKKCNSRIEDCQAKAKMSGFGILTDVVFVFEPLPSLVTSKDAS